MPCNTITTVSLDLKNAVPDVLSEAMRSLGYEVTATSPLSFTGRNRQTGATFEWSRSTGLQIRGYAGQTEEAKIMPAYSKAAVAWAAKRNGWTVKTTTGDKMQLVRRF